MQSNALVQQELLSRIERLVGASIETCHEVQGGYTPALRLLCRTSTASFFVKVGATPLTSRFLRREIDIYKSISGEFMPKLVAADEGESEPILIIEDLSAYEWKPSWDAHRVELVRGQIDAMHATIALLEPYGQIRPAGEANWQDVATNPEPFFSLGLVDSDWLERALPDLIAGEAKCTPDGTSLCHWDLRSDNICTAPDKAVFVDWNGACLSNPELDLGFWLPSLEFEGGPKPESILPNSPQIAAWVAGYFGARAGLPDIPDALGVRLVQRQQLQTALPWAVRALGLPPLNRRDERESIGMR